MHRLLVTLFILTLLPIAGADEVSPADLMGTWVNKVQQKNKDNMLGKVTWIRLKIKEAGKVKWTWNRDGKQETHEGSYSLQNLSDPDHITKDKDELPSLMIIPETLAVRRPIPLNNISTEVDGKPAEKTMTCTDHAGNKLVFVHKNDSEKN